MIPTRCAGQFDDEPRCRAKAVYTRDGADRCLACDRYYVSITPLTGPRTSTPYGAALERSYAAEVAYVEAHGDWRRDNPQWL